jgi:hypothetical protein
MKKAVKSKEDKSNIFLIGDLIAHRKSGTQGYIRGFEHSGVMRAKIEVADHKGFYVIDTAELDLVERKEQTKEKVNEKEDSQKGNSKED